MRFKRYGKSWHLVINSEAALSSILELNEAHWVATSAPVESIRADTTFLSLMDTDNDGRIHASNLKAAIRWTLEHLSDHSGIGKSSDTLQIEAIHTESESGTRILESVRRMLTRLDRPEDKSISLAEIRRIKEEVEKNPVSEAGVVLPEAAEEESLQQFLADIVNVTGGTNHPSGKPGISEQQVKSFLELAKNQVEWNRRGRLEDNQSSSGILPLGEDTPQAYLAYKELRAKFDEYFAWCEALAVDGRMAEQLPPREGDLLQADFSEPAALETFLRQAPIARPTEKQVFDFHAGVNPLYAEPLARFQKYVFLPLFGPESHQLNVKRWREIEAILSRYENWLDQKPDGNIGQIPEERLFNYLNSPLSARAMQLIEQRRETSLQLDNIRIAEKLALFQANLLHICRNFVSFPHLYDPGSRALFELGTLIMDGRRFNMAVQVDSRAEHITSAQLGNLFVLYVRIEAPEPYEAALPVTSGGRGNLAVGKRGIFQDIHGNEWDARVVQIIENPISLREAMVSPFRRLGLLVTGKIEQLTSSAGKSFETSVQKTMSVPPSSPPAPSATTPASRGVMAGGLLAGGGVAIAALSTALAYISKVVAEGGAPLLIGGLLGALLAVLLPTIILAFIKLNRRDLSPILEGSGWAINARMRLSTRQRRYFTQRPPYPLGAHIGSRVLKIVVITLAAILLFAALGKIYEHYTTSAPSGLPKKSESSEFHKPPSP
jgi:hypothetical protein